METPDELTMAERGDRDAQFNLALRYQDGTGFPRDYQQARRWYIEAAKQGHTTAQYSLGLLLAKGLGRPKDVEAAAAWYRKAAEGGHQAAQFNLAQMYEQGEGVPRDLMMAYVWFALAGASSAPSGAPGKRGRFTLQLFPASKSRTVAEMHRNRLGLLMSESERGKATQVAEEYFAKHVQPFR